MITPACAVHFSSRIVLTASFVSDMLMRCVCNLVTNIERDREAPIAPKRGVMQIVETQHSTTDNGKMTSSSKTGDVHDLFTSCNQTNKTPPCEEVVWRIWAMYGCACVQDSGY